MSEASLAVQGINKLNLELEEKQRELQGSNEKGYYMYKLVCCFLTLNSCWSEGYPLSKFVIKRIPIIVQHKIVKIWILKYWRWNDFNWEDPFTQKDYNDFMENISTKRYHHANSSPTLSYFVFIYFSCRTFCDATRTRDAVHKNITSSWWENG